MPKIKVSQQVVNRWGKKYIAVDWCIDVETEDMIYFSTQPVSEEKPQVEDVKVTETLSIEDMKKILDDNEIKYSHLAKENGLMKLLQENKLI